MSITKSFTTREQYIAWRAAWRTEYKNLSIAIRTLKSTISEMQSKGELAGAQQVRLISFRAQATEMLSTRLLSKVRAGLLREKSDLEPKQLAEFVSAELHDAMMACAEATIAKRKEKALASQTAAKTISKQKKSERVMKRKTSTPQMADAAD
jgi:hypothetical protein